MESERQESLAHGFPEFEVRVRCGSRHEAEALAERLRSEDIRCVHRWQFVVVGRARRGHGARTGRTDPLRGACGLHGHGRGEHPEAVSEAPLATPFSPFAVFGGLGG